MNGYRADADASSRSSTPGVSHRNAFDLLRLIGALLVLVDHSWVLSGHLALLPVASGTGFGGIGVDIFFLISGFLIPSSWLSDPSFVRFAVRRGLRIYPAFFVIIVLLTFVLGPLLTTLPLGSYLTSSDTYVFLGRNLLIFPMSFHLPGVFHDLPFPDAIDGSLWTIPVEVLCYVGVALLGTAWLLGKRIVLVVLATAALTLTTYIHITGYHGLLIPHLLNYNAAEPITLFVIGTLVRALRPRGIPPWWAPLLLIPVWFACWGTPLANLAAILAVACATLVISFRSPLWLHHPTRRYDLSYGTYVIAFPVEQCLVHFGLRQPVLLLLASILIVLPLAALSWRCIERPALRIKPQRAGSGAGKPQRPIVPGLSRKPPVGSGPPNLRAQPGQRRDRPEDNSSRPAPPAADVIGYPSTPRPGLQTSQISAWLHQHSCLIPMFRSVRAPSLEPG